MVRQIMNAIAKISQKNNVSKRTKIRLDCLYIAYRRSCMIAAGTMSVMHAFC